MSVFYVEQTEAKCITYKVIFCNGLILISLSVLHKIVASCTDRDSKLKKM